MSDNKNEHLVVAVFDSKDLAAQPKLLKTGTRRMRISSWAQ
jgi:hypothetical protein